MLQGRLHERIDCSMSAVAVSPTAYRRVVAIAALGYLVDIFDLIIFGIVRVQSLRDLGLNEEQIITSGIDILNAQMIGMLLGGLLWGAVGDKFGRVKVLIGSILMYSSANIMTGFISSVDEYMLWRFIGGIGLAGELGAGVTLALESMPKNIRGLGGAFIAAVGVLGAVLAEVIVNFVDWRTAYIIGGVMGLVVMCFRFTLHESEMFKSHKADKVAHGSFLAILSSRRLFGKYLACVLIGVPIWFSIGLLAYFAPEFAKALNIEGAISAGKAIMYMYIGMSIGGITSGLLSQALKSRRQAIFVYMALLAVGAVVYSQFSGASVAQFYAMLVFLGVGAGYWSLLTINASEQFGVNFRATAATTVPNFVRGAVVPMTLAFGALRHDIGMLEAATVVGVVVFALAAVAAWRLQETFHKDLNLLEGATSPDDHGTAATKGKAA